MSWSFAATGTPEKIIAEIKRVCDKEYTAGTQSRLEFERALPHLVGLLELNYANPGSGYDEPIVRIEASGSGTTKNGEQVAEQVTAKIERVWGKLLV